MKEPIIKIRDISDEEIIKEMEKHKGNIHFIETEEDIDKFLEELDKKLDKEGDNIG